MLRTAHTLFAVTLLPTALGLVACGGGGGPTLRDRDNNGNIVGGNNNGGGNNNATRDGGSGNNNTNNNNNNNNGGVDGGPSGSDGGVQMPEPVAPTLSLATAQASGRRGEHLLVHVGGVDRNRDVTAVSIRLLDSAGREIPLIDTDFDGFPDSASFVRSVAPSYDDQDAFSESVRFDGLLARTEEVTEIEVHLLDALAQSSSPEHANVSAQTIVALGEACDADHTTRRCDDGLGCVGDPAVCVEGSPPELVDFAYYQMQDGLRVLMRGTDPDDDLWRIRLEFLDAAGNAISIDLDADGEVDSEAFEVDATGASEGGAFFAEIRPTASFGREVQQLAARPYDARQAPGNRVTATKTVPPRRRNGDRCDPRGFDQCLANSVCFPGVPDASNTCIDKSARRAAACSAAPVLRLDRPGVPRAFVGETLGASLWDAPLGCAVLDPTERPERAIRLDLRERANRLTLTTDLAGTGFNTVIYVIDGCQLDSEPRLGCHDNVPMGVGSELVLENVPAGLYTVIVDAWGLSGGTFELVATFE